MRGHGTRRLLWSLLLSLMVGAVQGARITDKLLVGLYPSPNATQAPLRVLPSDAPLERLEKSGDFTQVRLGDGTKGWVETRFITDEKPARIMLLELQAKNSTLSQRLRAAEQELKALGSSPPERGTNPAEAEAKALLRQLEDAQAEVTSLKQALAAAKAANPTAAAAAATQSSVELGSLRQTNQRLQQQLQQIAEIIGMTPAEPAPPSGTELSTWYLPLLLLALLFSFIGGVTFKNYRLAKRYGGFRI